MRPRFLARDLDAKFDALGVMRNDLAADAVLERRDDLAAGRVVFGIGGEAEQDIECEAHRIPFDLHVAFLHDVEQAHLHLAREVGQFVQREDPAVGARQHAVVNGEFVAQDVSTAGGLDGVHVTDDVGNGRIGRRKFFDVALIAGHPADRRVVAMLLNELPGVLGDRAERIVVHFAAGHDGHLLVE